MDKRKFGLSGGFFLIFIIYTLLVRFVGRAAIGPKDSFVGFAGLNGAVRDAVGRSNIWKGISTFSGIIAIAVAGVFVILGLYQLIRYRSLMGVDPDIYALGVVYVLTAATYLLFEKVIINYRPVLENGELAASYPSSHTMLMVTIYGTAVAALHRRIKDRGTSLVIKGAAFVMMLIGVLGRTLSGVHWITDIIGSLIIGVAFITLYSALTDYSFVLRDSIRNKPKKRKEE